MLRQIAAQTEKEITQLLWFLVLQNSDEIADLRGAQLALHEDAVLPQFDIVLANKQSFTVCVWENDRDKERQDAIENITDREEK